MENLKELNQIIETKSKLQKNIRALKDLDYYANGRQSGLFVEDLRFRDIEEKLPGIMEKAKQSFKDVFELEMLKLIKACESEISKYEILKRDI